MCDALFADKRIQCDIIKHVIMNSELTKTLKSIVSKKVVPKQLKLHSSFVDWHWFRHVEVIE